jgi:hypothetical protein
VRQADDADVALYTSYQNMSDGLSDFELAKQVYGRQATDRAPIGVAVRSDDDSRAIYEAYSRAGQF